MSLKKGEKKMRILHTSDWHLGKTLEQYSRLEEQEEFLEEFIEIVEKNNIDLVLIAGDIYDNGNPPARAEGMFYNTLKKITSSGKTAVDSCEAPLKWLPLFSPAFLRQPH